MDDEYKELKNACFLAIYDDGAEDCGDWIQTLIENYATQVVDVIGNDPYEVYPLLEDWWTSMDYEDYRTGICLTYRDWATYFAGEFSHVIYDELIEAKALITNICRTLQRSKLQ